MLRGKNLRKTVFQWGSLAVVFLGWLQGHLLWTLLDLIHSSYSVAGTIQMLQMLAGSLGLHRCHCQWHLLCGSWGSCWAQGELTVGRQRCLCPICCVLCYVLAVNPWNPRADNPPYQAPEVNAKAGKAGQAQNQELPCCGLCLLTDTKNMCSMQAAVPSHLHLLHVLAPMPHWRGLFLLMSPVQTDNCQKCLSSASLGQNLGPAWSCLR